MSNCVRRHGSEPAVSLTYSDKSSTSATISLGVGDEVTRDSYHPGKKNIQKFLKKFFLREIRIVFFTIYISQDRLEVPATKLSTRVRATIASITATETSEKVSVTSDDATLFFDRFVGSYRVMCLQKPKRKPRTLTATTRTFNRAKGPLKCSFRLLVKFVVGATNLLQQQLVCSQTPKFGPGDRDRGGDRQRSVVARTRDVRRYLSHGTLC